MPIAPPIPYEVLRRTCGAVAFSTDAGNIGFCATSAKIVAGDILLIGATDRHQRLLKSPPQDVIEKIQQDLHLPLFEFAGGRIVAQHDISLTTGEPN